jgi:ABC-type lipoprotein release transport system permease subunit
MAGRLLDRLVHGVHAIELSTTVLAISVLVGAGFLASFVPARRASLVDAMTALRHE